MGPFFVFVAQVSNRVLRDGGRRRFYNVNRALVQCVEYVKGLCYCWVCLLLARSEPKPKYEW